MASNSQPCGAICPARRSSNSASPPTTKYSTTSSASRANKGLPALATGPSSPQRWLTKGPLAAMKAATMMSQTEPERDMKQPGFQSKHAPDGPQRPRRRATADQRISGGAAGGDGISASAPAGMAQCPCLQMPSRSDSKQAWRLRARRCGDPQVPEGGLRGDASARCALQETLLYQIGLDHVFDGAGFFANAGGDVVQPDGAAVEAVDHGFEQFAVHHVQALGVYVEHGQGALGNVLGDVAVGLDLGVVAHAPQQPVGDARRAARAAGDLQTPGVIHRDTEQAGAALDDARQFLRAVELQPGHDAEAVAQRIGQHAGARGRTDQGEG